MECGKSQIVKHESTVGHQEKVELSDKLTSYGILCKSNSSNPAAHFSSATFLATDNEIPDVDVEDVEDFQDDSEPAFFKKKVQEAEIKITTFFLEHNLAF